MAKKRFALNPRERDKECSHELGFRYNGTIPCTGPKVCLMCGEQEERAALRKAGLKLDEHGFITP
jgi:hypothetical protein